MDLLGLFLAILSGAGYAGFDFIRKHLANRMEIFNLLIWVFILQSLLFLSYNLVSPSEFMGDGDGIWHWDYPPFLIGLSLMAAVANYLFVISMKKGELSTTLPLLAFIPVFTSLNGYFFLEQSLSPPDIAGIAFIVLGALLLQTGATTFVSRLKALFQTQSSVYMLICALIFSSMPVLDVHALEYVAPGWHGLWLCSLATVFLWFIAHFKKIPTIPPTAAQAGWLAFGACSIALGLFFYFWAIQIIPIGLFETIKRVVGLIAAQVLGVLIFREKFTAMKGLASLIMAAGTMLILTS